MKKVIVIGGGITGLTAAYYLQRRARAGEAVQWTLLESSDRLGGKVLTDRTDNGYTIEAGPDSFVTDKTACIDLCHELGLGGELIPANEKQRKIYVLHRGRLMTLPAGFRLAIPTEFLPFITTRLLSLRGKLRMALEVFIPRGPATEDVTLAQFFGRRFGRECVDRLAGPLMAGIFVSDPYTMSMRGTFPMFVDMEQKFGSLIRAAQYAKTHPRPPNPKAAGRSMFNSLKRGLGSMMDALAGALKDGDVRLNCPVKALRRISGSRWVIETEQGPMEADDIILAVPSYVAASLLAPHHEPLAKMLYGIRYVSTATVSFAYLRSEIPLDLDGFGVLVPPAEKRRIIACTWSSVKFKHRAPSGSVLLRGFVGGCRQEEYAALPDEELIQLVRDEYRELFDITAEPLLHRIYRWPKANPQYDVGHPARVKEMEQLAAGLGGIHLAGSPYHGIGMPDCVRSAQRAVDLICPPAAPATR